MSVARRLAAPLLAALFLTLCASALSARPALALDVPDNGGRWVVDDANLLSDQEEAALGAELHRFATATGNQIVILTIDSLQGEDAPDYANKVARAWGVGQKNANNGVLILVAKAEARVRFEVGRGVEDRLTDVACKRIQRQITVPLFRQGKFAQGLLESVTVMEQLLEPDASGQPNPAQQPRPAGSRTGPPLFFTIMLLIVAGILALELFWRRYGSRYDAGEYSGGRGGHGSSFLLGFILGILSNIFRGRGGGGGFGGGGFGGGGFGGGDDGGGFSGGGGDFGGGGGDSGFGGDDS